MHFTYNSSKQFTLTVVSLWAVDASAFTAGQSRPNCVVRRNLCVRSPAVLIGDVYVSPCEKADVYRERWGT
jgi:hypothetical protein